MHTIKITGNYIKDYDHMIDFNKPPIDFSVNIEISDIEKVYYDRINRNISFSVLVKVAKKLKVSKEMVNIRFLEFL